MTRLVAPANAPAWLPEYTRSIERAMRERPFRVTATGTGSSQNVTLPKANLLTTDVMVFVSGALVTAYTISGRTLTITATAAAPIVIFER